MSRRSLLPPTADAARSAGRVTGRYARMWSEAPTPLNTHRLPNTGEGGDWDPAWPQDVSWLSPDVSWLDPGWSWLG